MYPRLAADRLRDAARRFPAVVILGARQVGKTTLARSAFPELPHVDCQDPAMAAALRSDPRFVLAGRERGGLIVDDGSLSTADRAYVALTLRLSDGRALHYRDVRRLGTVALMAPDRFSQYSNALGAEPLDPQLGDAVF